jgi:long-subunit fatty acid transport protein
MRPKRSALGSSRIMRAPNCAASTHRKASVPDTDTWSSSLPMTQVSQPHTSGSAGAASEFMATSVCKQQRTSSYGAHRDRRIAPADTNS